MSAGLQSLTEKEKQTLRLIVRGHDAKSMARHLGLSVHTINERLRDARRKLDVSSSREAARLLHDTESAPENSADKPMGEAATADAVTLPDLPNTGRWRAPGAAWIIAGVVVMSVLLAVLALAPSPQSATDPVSPPATAPTPVDSDVARAARAWLALHDAGRWRDGWAATGDSFRRLNTLERWTEVAQRVRPPLGAVISRTMLSQDSVSAPPAGIEVVTFRTDFANRADVVETVSLAREAGTWKVVGIYVE